MSLEELAERGNDLPTDTNSGTVTADWLALVADAAREIQPDRHAGVQQTAATITAAAVAVIPGAEHCAITVVARKSRTVQTLGPTTPIPVELNQVQQDAQEGPCLTALWDEPLVHSVLRLEQRWVDYTGAARERGIGAVLSIRLYAQDQDHVLGALSLYTSQPTGFDPDAVGVAEAYATHAAIALDQTQQQSTLRLAITSRDLIGQAKGILMERHRITADAAFQQLIGLSQHLNRPLRDIADQLIHTGELPADPHSR